EMCIRDRPIGALLRAMDPPPPADVIAAADAVVVIAGMEGALASVVGGLVARPVIACPTSVGYGSNFGGLAALLSMLSSCAPGVVCVGIDDGVGAGYSAAMIARRTAS
ncbi:MAG TPA: 1-(5-phosphoribosyl)-5-amino-4-imidazole-carboxylate carboxylase, partial [Actinobacteria bacterium]|nr:1-(5-phosphoribosyl)-5-amino-4-imidazole-carboxylate carboxylase [Actinomycetota bacterium]